MFKKNSILLLLALMLGLFGISQVSFAGAKKIKRFDSLVDSLEDGNIVRAVIDFDKCTVSNGKLEKRAPTGGMSFMAFMKTEKDIDGKKTVVVATTDTILINSEKYGLVYDHLSLRVMDNGTVSFASELVDPKNFNQLAETSYVCGFGKEGVKDTAAFFEVS